MELTIHLENGKALSFENVTILRAGVDFTIFTYVSVETGKKKRAKFNTQKIWGWVTSIEDDSK